jgi:hypothetical protein
MTGRHLAVYAAAANLLMWIGTAHANTILTLPVNDNAGIHSPVIFELPNGDWGLQLPGKAHGPKKTPGSAHDNSGHLNDGGSADPGGNSGGPQVPPTFNPPPFSDPPPFAGPPSADPPPFSGGGFTPPPFNDGGSTPPSVSNPPVTDPTDGSLGGTADGPLATTVAPEPGSLALLFGGGMYLVFRSSRSKRSLSDRG